MTAAACGDDQPAAGPTVPAVDVAAPGEGALHVLAADGINVAGVAPAFEAATGCHVTVEPHGSSADIVRTATSTSTDVFAVSGDAVLALTVAGAAAPIPRGADDDVIPAVRRAGESDGRRYGVPFVWGPEFILAARRSFPVPPTSYDVLFDPAYAGRIAVPDDPLPDRARRARARRARPLRARRPRPRRARPS